MTLTKRFRTLATTGFLVGTLDGLAAIVNYLQRREFSSEPQSSLSVLDYLFPSLLTGSIQSGPTRTIAFMKGKGDVSGCMIFESTMFHLWHNNTAFFPYTRQRFCTLEALS